MDFETTEYGKYFRIGEMAVVSTKLEGGIINELHGAIVQVTDVGAEMILLSNGAGNDLKGKETSASLLAITGHLRCDCPVIIGKNSDRNNLCLRFDGKATVTMLRKFLRCDVLIPFLYNEEKNADIKDLEKKWRATRSDAKLASFIPKEYGESYYVENWQDKGDILPSKVNLGGGGVRFTTAEEIKRGSFISLQMFLQYPKPAVLHAVMEVTRSEMFHLTQEDKAFYMYAKIRLKSQLICITAGKYVLIDEEDQAALVEYIRKRHEIPSAQP
ncbi:hypothetical protein [Geobacter sp. DSM 9736]|uniref:hypothetical protein n=1 Tax=Geobacter sp. DSM 9736 TaxID=1277350 RepID=UPI000B50268C|nr:hypothetical protein [Geobacter sp. DSM 9736]SNB45235.1 hypothetical protein SAMN06269301_0638 [Geobacter sp. DSM 9736]